MKKNTLTLAQLIQHLIEMRVGDPRILSLQRTGREAYVLQDMGSLGRGLQDGIDSVSHVVVPSDINYGKIVLNEELREFLPKARQQFIMGTDMGPFVLHRQNNSYLNAPRTSEVDRSLLPELGKHGVRPLHVWYQGHPKVNPGSRVTIYKESDLRFFLEA